MANPRLTSEQLKKARVLIDEISTGLNVLAEGDAELLFAYRRKVHKELMHMERGTAAQRNKLKDAKRAEQKDLCAECGEKLPPKYCVLDRTYAPAGYFADNTRLIHQECDKVKQQKLHFT